MTVQEIISFPDDLMNRPGADRNRWLRLQLGIGPYVVDLFRLTHEPHGVNFRRRGEGTDRDRHVIFSSLGINHILKEESLPLIFFQATELPPHERHQLGILVDLALDSYQFPSLLQGRQMLSQVSVIFAFHCGIPIKMDLAGGLAWVFLIFSSL